MGHAWDICGTFVGRLWDMRRRYIPGAIRNAGGAFEKSLLQVSDAKTQSQKPEIEAEGPKTVMPRGPHSKYMET